MATDTQELREAPALTPTTKDPFASKRKRVGKTLAERPSRRQPPVAFAEQEDPEPRDASTGAVALDDLEAPASSVSELEGKVKILWDEYMQRQHEQSKPKTMPYRCLGFRPDGAPCGFEVEAGTHEERIRTGEVVRCPHGPDAPDAGIFFDREQFPKFHYDLTPMEPIWPDGRAPR